MVLVIDDFERCYRFMQSRDPRYDGFFFVAVTSTGVYCRPSCPARLPSRRNVRLFRSAAAAQEGGFRACKRCDPDAAPGSPAWNRRADVAGRAVRLIADGAVDRHGVGGLAARLHFSERQLNRILVSELGAGAVSLARAQRAQSARTLSETTELPFAQVAVGAGFGSVRQFNDTVRAVYGRTPSELRRRARGRRATSSPGTIQLRLPCREPFDGESLLAFLAARAVPAVEEVSGGAYRRTLALEHGHALVALTPGAGAVRCELRLDDLRDLTAAAARCRRLLDLDADPLAVSAHLEHDPALAPLVRRRPGCACRAAWTASSWRCAPSWASRSRCARRAPCSDALAAAYGTSRADAFPQPAALAGADPAELPFPRTRARALVAPLGPGGGTASSRSTPAATGSRRASCSRRSPA